MPGLAMVPRCLAALVLWCTGVCWGADVVILSSERSAGYSEAAQAVVAELVRSGIDRAEIVQLVVPDVPGADVVGLQGGKVWITLGAEALGRALPREGHPPIVAALIPRLGFERILRDTVHKSATGIAALYLDQPFARQLDLLRLALPDAKRVGVLWGHESMLQQVGLMAAAQSRGLEVVGGAVTSPITLYAGLKTVLSDTDVLLAVADPAVYNGTTISNILLATYRSRVPLMAFSPAYTKAGALMSLHSAPRQIGGQAATMARAVLQGGALPASQYPMEFSVVVNDYVARSLGLMLDEGVLTERLRRLEKRP
jgi:putative ABC transport system substrate-binding protein